MADHFVTSTDGVRIAVHEYGDPDGPVLVAVHGYPDNHRVWDGIARELRSVEDEMRSGRHEDAILLAERLALGAVGEDDGIAPACPRGDGRPLAADGEPGTAATEQPGGLEDGRQRVPLGEARDGSEAPEVVGERLGTRREVGAGEQASGHQRVPRPACAGPALTSARMARGEAGIVRRKASAATTDPIATASTSSIQGAVASLPAVIECRTASGQPA